MKKQQKKVLKSSSTSPRKKRSAVALVAPLSPLRHLRLVQHAHTGKLVHRQHTSHGLLILLLLFVGVFMFAVQHMSSAVSGTVTVGAVVNGPPPSVGAAITSPAEGAVIVDQTMIVVSGTCAPSTFVVVESNNILVGSTNCTVAGLFSLTVDLSVGQNSLTALNFDNANQPGPVTSAVVITLSQSQPSEPESPSAFPEISLPVLPDNPSLIPGLPNSGWWCGGLTSVTSDSERSDSKVIEQVCSPPIDCNSYVPEGTITSGGDLSISVVCLPRIIERNQLYTMGIIIRGGAPPYALNIDFGSDDEDALSSVASAGYKAISFRYTNVGAFNQSLSVTDSKGQTAFVETGVRVSGESESLVATIAKAVAPENWFTSPVPIYVVAVLTTLAFWGGDLFDRRFGGRKSTHSGGRKRAA